MIIRIDRQNDVPKITEPGKLVYSEKSDALFIRTLKEGTKVIGGNNTTIVETDPIFSAWLATPPNVSIFTNDAGYLTSFSETDPVYTASSWYSTTNNATNWNTSFGWGNHASAGYLTSITSGQITTALGFTPVTNARTLTINGTTYDLSADRSWTVSGGISTLNTLTGATQTFATGTTGTDFTISSLGTTHTFNIPTASSSNRGVLSTTDWTTFNSKESALTFSTGLTRTSNTITSNISTGVSGGQTIIGGTASGNSLTLSSTSNATKGKLLFGTSAYDEVNNRLGIGNTSPSYALDVNGDIRVNNIYRFQAGQSFSVSGSTININANNGTVWNANLTGSTLLALSNAGIFGFTAGFVTGYTNPFIALGVHRESSTNWRAQLAYPITFQNLAGDIAITQDTGKTYGGIFTPTETVRLKAGGTVGIGVTSPSAYLSIKASTTSIPHLNLTAGSAPSSPTNGDIWFDGTDIKMRIGGVTKTFTLT